MHAVSFGLGLAFLMVAASPAAVAQTVPAPVQVAPPISQLAQIPGVAIQYYNVSGATIKDLQASMDTQAPKNPSTGLSVPSSSNWSIGASMKKSTTGTVCKIVGATAKFQGQVVMPRFVPTEGVAVPVPVMAEWQRYVTSLEQQHANTLRQVSGRVSEVEKAVMASSCEGAGQAADQAISAIRQSIVPIAPAPAASPAAAPTKG